ncbi:MAG: HAD family hydrolase [Marinifilaceae bacterium]
MKIPEVYPETRALIFDLDGTLANTIPMHYLAWTKAAQIHNFEFSKELFLECTGLPTYKIVEVLNQNYNLQLDPYHFSRLKEDFFRENMKDIQPIQPIVELIYRYHKILPMAVGTGGKKSIAIRTMEVLGLDQYISILVSSEDVKNHKPAPDTFLKCAELLEVPPQYCQVFEDGERGIQAAKNARMMVTDVRKFYSTNL